MRSDVPSRTAAWVAAMRGLGAFLAPGERLVDDPFGLRFAGRLAALRDSARVEERARATARLWLRGRLRATVLLLQLRTRVIDDDVADFARAGGRQLVLLGAGFDCRAWRLASVLRDATVFEVDHPATQAKKRAVVGDAGTSARVVFVPWNFEDEPLDRLPARLGLDGHDASAPTMTILEGVTPYLTPEAIEATFACVARYSPPASPLAFTFIERALLSSRARAAVGERTAVRLLGEPFRFGFDPGELPEWLARRGFRIERDESTGRVASRFLSADVARFLASSEHRARRHFALARVAPRGC